MRLQNQADELLEQRARDLLARASVIAEASAKQIGGQTSHTRRNESAGPTIAGTATLDEILLRLNAARGRRSFIAALEWAELELDRLIRGPPRHAETKEQFRFRVCDEHEGRNYRLAAGIEKVSVAYIRKIREADGRDPLTGRKLKP